MIRPGLSSDPPDASDSVIARGGRLGLIVLLHAGLFLLLQAGLAQQPRRDPAPQTVLVSFVTPEPAPVPPPEPPPPKPQPKPIKKPVRKVVKPTPPPVEQPPSEKAIAAPPPPPPEPVAPPVAAAPAVPAPPARPAPPPPPAPAQPRRVTSGIAYLQPPEPDYPAISRRMGEEGKAVLRVLVNERGRPERAEVETSSGSPRLDEAARRAALRAIFKPHIEDGRAVPVYAIIPIRFQLDS